MPVGEQEVGKRSGVSQALKNRVDEACVAEVVQSGSDGSRLRPGQLDLLLAEQGLCRQAKAVRILGNSRGRGACRVSRVGDCCCWRNAVGGRAVERSFDRLVLLLQTFLYLVQAGAFYELNASCVERRVALL